MGSVAERIALFRELLGSVGNICLTEFDSDYELINTGGASIDIIPLFFVVNGGKELEWMPVNEDENLKPLKRSSGPTVFTNPLGLAWLSDVEVRDGRIYRIYLLGPVFLDDYSVRRIEHELDRIQVSLTIKRSFLDIIRIMPVLTVNRFYEYGIMLRCCLTGERISIDDFIRPELSWMPRENGECFQKRHGTFRSESAILKLVEDGNLSYKEEMKNLAVTGEMGRVSNGDYLRQAKNTVIIFCALCARAAIRGGLDSETSYELSDGYIRQVEAAENLAQVDEVNKVMLDDFIRRVHRLKTQTGISPQIRQSCDYICLHLSERPDIHLLASRLGYTDYYFSSKFKKETGMTVRDYATKRRMERAGELLRDSNMDIQEIAAALGFGSQSYFGEVFRSETGMSPTRYRKCRE